MLSISNLNVVFPDGTRAISDVSFNVKAGEFTVILGPSGAGKTTLLRSICGLIQPSGGGITLNGLPVRKDTLPGIRANVGMVFQGFDLVGNLSALNNVLTGLLEISPALSSVFYLFSRQQKLDALDCLDRVGLLAKAYSRADHLSGGQQQRVGIARAIVKNPLLLLADEPVASLDPMIAFNILTLLKKINVSHGITVVCNLHQVDFAFEFADHIIGLSESRIIMDLPIQSVDKTYIQDIYKGHDQGMFYGPAASRPKPEDNLEFPA